MKNSFVIGDMGMSDIILARNIGAKGILVLTGVGKGSLGDFRHTWRDYEADYIAENVLDAVKWVCSKVASEFECEYWTLRICSSKQIVYKRNSLNESSQAISFIYFEINIKN